MDNAADERRVERVKGAINLAKQRMARLVVRDAYGNEPCVYCGGPAKSLDHVIPASRGGRNHLPNLVPACNCCNKLKRDLLPQDFFSKHPRFAWRFGERAIHAEPAIRAIAVHHGKRYSPRQILFDGADIFPDEAPK